MKKIRKIIALALATVMMMAMSITAFAEEAGKTFTFSKVGVEKGTVSYFKIVEPDTTNTTGWNFVEESYGDAFVDALKGENADYTTQDALNDLTSTVNGAEKTTAADRAEALQSIVDSLTDNSTWNTNEFTAVNDSFTLNLKEAGYYVVKIDSSSKDYSYKLMSVSVLPSELNGGTETREVKKADNVVVKTLTNNDDKYVELQDKVEYTITSEVPYFYPEQTDAYFFIYDYLTGATYDSLTDNVVKVNVKIGDANPVEYDAEYNAADNGFALDLSSLVKNADGKAISTNAYKTVVVTYSVTVTSTIVENKAYPGYSNHNPKDDQGFEEPTPIKSFSGKVNVIKVDANNEATKLKGAKFALAKEVTVDGKVTLVIATVNNDGKLTWSDTNYNTSNDIVKAAVAENSDIRTWETDNKGTVLVEGLDRDQTYYLYEVVAPDGYSLNAEPQKVSFNELTDDTKEMVQEANDLTVKDTTLSTLPFTGGMGTTIFTVLGVAIMVLAAALYFVSKRKATK